MRLIPLILLAACVSDGAPQPLPLEQAAVYSNSVSAVLPGQMLTSTLTDQSVSTSIPVGTTTIIRVGTTLEDGGCPTQVLTECMDIGFPGVNSAPAIMQGGSVTNQIPVPRSLADGTTVYVQTVGQTRGGVSRVGGITERRVGCGDGVVGVAEQCDDGNVSRRDGCSAQCLTEYDHGALWAGIRYGRCQGNECNFLVRLDFAPEVFLSVGSFGSAGSSSADNRGQLTLLGQQTLADANGEVDAAVPLDPVYGCPDCFDQGELYLNIFDYVNRVSTEVVVDPTAVPPELAGIEALRVPLLDALSTCVANAYVVPASNCVPL